MVIFSHSITSVCVNSKVPIVLIVSSNNFTRKQFQQQFHTENSQDEVAETYISVDSDRITVMGDLERAWSVSAKNMNWSDLQTRYYYIYYFIYTHEYVCASVYHTDRPRTLLVRRHPAVQKINMKG